MEVKVIGEDNSPSETAPTRLAPEKRASFAPSCIAPSADDKFNETVAPAGQRPPALSADSLASELENAFGTLGGKVEGDEGAFGSLKIPATPPPMRPTPPPSLLPHHIRAFASLKGALNFSEFVQGLVSPLYTEAFGMDVGLLSLVMTQAKCVDFVTSFLVGHASDNASTRWGRRRPFIALGAPLSAIFLLLLVHPPAGARHRHVLPPRAAATCHRHVPPPRATATCGRHVHRHAWPPPPILLPLPLPAQGCSRRRGRRHSRRRAATGPTGPTGWAAPPSPPPATARPCGRAWRRGS